MRNARPKKAVPADPQIAEEPLDAPRPSAESLLEKIPLNILSRKELAEALAAAAKAANKVMSLEDQIDGYVRAGRQALVKIQYLSACDRRRIETGLWLEKEKENVRDYPPDVLATIGRMLAETAALFTTIGIPDCAKELLRHRQLSAQGRAARKPKKSHLWIKKKLLEYVDSDPAISVASANHKLFREPDVPMEIAENPRKVISKLLKEIKANLRPVRGG